MEVNMYRIKDIDNREVSAFIMKVKKASGQWRKETTLVALVHDSAVVGFSLVRPTHGEKNGHL